MVPIRSPFAGLDAARYELPSPIARRLVTPVLCIHEAPARRNIARIVALCGGDPSRWRPHLKTTKSPLVWSWLLEAGVRHFKCATLCEARVFAELTAERGLDDVDLLVAQPLVGAPLQRLGALARAHPRLRLGVLSEDPVAAGGAPAELGLFIDVNLGLDRTGIPHRDWPLVQAVAAACGARLRGLHAYEGLVDTDPAGRRARCAERYDELARMVDGLHRARTPVAELVTSGTPTFLDALAHPGFASSARGGSLGSTLHRVSPGTVVLHDARSALDVPELELEPAALVLARVVSHPRPDRATCDAGSKSLAAETGDPCAFALSHPWLAASRPSEEHLPLDLRPDAAAHRSLPARGELVSLVPTHVCPTVNHFDEAWLVAEEGSLSRLAIAARGHPLEGLEALVD